jgi:hypothetical protein
VLTDMPLSCSSDYRFLVNDRCRDGTQGKTMVEITDYVLSAKWNRVLNAPSKAQVALPSGCCDALSEVREGRDLLIFRDGDLAWNGEIWYDPTDCSQATGIIAYDRWAILWRRLIQKRLCFRTQCGGAKASVKDVVTALITDASVDGRCLIDNFRFLGDCPSVIERDFLEDSMYTMTAIEGLVRSRIDFTSSGNWLIAMCKSRSIGKLPTLTCEHFTTELCRGSAGLDAATRVVIEGDGVTGSAGGIDPYYGLLEVRREDDSIKSQAAADDEAASTLLQLKPPLNWITAQSGAVLTPQAPVELEHLVPGSVIPVLLDCVCIPLAETMRLVEVEVNYVASTGTGGSGGESVSITLASSREGRFSDLTGGF